jgi:hypothetical protein
MIPTWRELADRFRMLCYVTWRHSAFRRWRRRRYVRLRGLRVERLRRFADEVRPPFGTLLGVPIAVQNIAALQNIAANVERNNRLACEALADARREFDIVHNEAMKQYVVNGVTVSETELIRERAELRTSSRGSRMGRDVELVIRKRPPIKES